MFLISSSMPLSQIKNFLKAVALKNNNIDFIAACSVLDFCIKLWKYRIEFKIVHALKMFLEGL